MVPPASVSVAGGTMSTWLAVGTISPCFHGPLHVSFCALGEAGWFGAAGHVAPSRQDGEAFASAGARVGLDIPLSKRWLLGAHVDGLAALTRFDVRVSDVPVFTVPPVSLAIAAGVGASF
jgi:hypothetical protein